MGLLVEGKALTPEEMKDVLKYIREHGIIQFINTYQRVKDIEEDQLRFGDEIEMGIFVYDSNEKTIKLTLRGAELRKYLTEKEELYAHESEGATWHPEWGAWMIESTPSKPYNNYATDLLRVERNMVLRRRRLLAALGPNEIAPTISCFPLMGVGNFIHNAQPFEVPYSKSDYIPDYIINPHPRFAALVNNIRCRRGEKVDIRVPLFKDVNTPEFNRQSSKEIKLPEGYRLEEDEYIHMDAMGFGMGMCCLQVTFQARDIDESRYMYDQLAVLAPIMMAMTAATPFYKGRLADTDARWSVIAQSVDDRTPEERGIISNNNSGDDRMVGNGITPIPKSRYDSISTYIYHCKGDSACHRTFEVYNDIYCPVDNNIKLLLRNNNIDENLAHHISHLYCRDPLVAFHNQIILNDDISTDHFESIQSTNWQTVRWKPPPPLSTTPITTTTNNNATNSNSRDVNHIGWRTEFRSMEVQLTDFENAAFTVFIVLLTRVVLAFDLSLYIPLSKVDENMRRSHLKNSINNEKFYFRKFIAPIPCCLDELEKNDNVTNNTHTAYNTKDNLDSSGYRSPCSKQDNINLDPEDMWDEMTIIEIFLGKGNYFPGLLPLVYAYLDYINCDEATYKKVSKYLQFIEKRAKGELMTPATWMRKFITEHPSYNKDSVISPEIAHDLMLRCQQIGEGSVECPEILGDIKFNKIRKEDAYGQILAGKLDHYQKSQLIKNLMSRGFTSQIRPESVARGKSRTYSVGEDYIADPESIEDIMKLSAMS